MKNKIALSLVPLIAAVLMSGCDDGPNQEVNRSCVDQNNNVVDAQKCETMYQNHGVVRGNANWYYFWYYSNGGYRPNVGERIIIAPGRGSFVAPEGAEFAPGARVGSVSRGGFGSSAGSVGE